MKASCAPAVLPIEQRVYYYQTLDMAHSANNYTIFARLVVDIVIDGFRSYEWACGIEKLED